MLLTSLIKIIGMAVLGLSTGPPNGLSIPSASRSSTCVPSPLPSPWCTFLAVQPLEAQGTVTLIALLPGSAAAPVGAGGSHTGVGCILHVHAPREVMLHVDGPVIQDDLRKENVKKFRNSENVFSVFYSFPQLM